MTTALGLALAVAAALGWAAQYVFVRLGTVENDPIDAVLFTMGTNVLVITPIALIIGDGLSLSLEPFLAFVVAGLTMVLGILFQFWGTRAVGASRTAPVVSASVLVSTIVAVVMLGESLAALHLVGILLIVSGIVFISRETEEATSRVTVQSATAVVRRLWIPLLSAFFFGVEPIAMKIGLDRGASQFQGLLIMTWIGAVAVLGYLVLGSGPSVRERLGTSARRMFLGAGFCGTISLVSYVGALSVLPVVVATPILQVAPLLVLGLSIVFLDGLEIVTARLAIASSIVVGGAILVSLVG